ncbi:MAG: cytochrome c-type biogenesis protein CcmF [Halobacteriales archaeon]|jgi:cytochrome c-type biogenesis protein CcmF
MIGTLLQHGAFGVSLAATIILWYAVVRVEYADYGAYAFGTSTLLSGFALFYLGSQFAVTDYTNGYVWEHTADYLPLLYRITGVYAGVNGSLLLWATMVAVVAYWVVRQGVDTPAQRRIAAILATVVTFFFGYAITRTPFTDLSIAAQGTAFGPVGLNPLLKSPYMVVHPPVTFAGYATTVVPFAIGMAHFVSRVRGEPGIFENRIGDVTRWLRVSWWFLTASVALGALWSYTTLGWGGLWAWDPVETAVLVTWLFVTAAMHVVSNYRTRGRNSILAPAMSVLVFPSAIFARVMTQSGTSELHSFASGSPTWLTGLLVVTAGLGVVLPLYRWLQEPDEPDPESSGLLSQDQLLVLGVVILGLLTFVSFWGLVFPLLQDFLGGPPAEVSVTFFNLWSFPLAVAALLTIGLYNDYDVRGRNALRLLGVVVVGTVLVALVPLSKWQFDPSQTGGYYGVVGHLNALSLFPPAAYAIGATLTRMAIHLPSLDDRDRALTLGGTGIAHVGIALIILATPMTYMFAVSGAGLVPGVASGHANGVSLGDSGYTVAVENFSSSHVHSELSLTEQERTLVTEQIGARAARATELSDSATGNRIVFGRITDLRRDSQTGFAQLDNTSVWVDVGPVSPNASLQGLPIYAQGTINRSTPNATLVRTDGMFVGTEPTGAIVPDNRATHREITVTVRRGDRTVARGTTSVDYHIAYGAVGNPTIDRGILSETYVAAQNVQYSSGMPVVSLVVKQVPLMNVVRVGIALLLVGGGLLVVADPGHDAAEDSGE